MKNLFLFFFVIIAIVNIQAQNVDVKLGGATKIERFNIQNNNGDTLVYVQANGQTFHKDSSAATNPLVMLLQKYTGDATLTYALTSFPTTMATGLDNDDNDNFKICNFPILTGIVYNDANTMLRIHTENTQAGIIDFNHQSRARAWLVMPQMINSGAWFPIQFNVANFDEHVEFVVGPGGPGSPAFFVAKEEGYYQVNARCEFSAWDPAPVSGIVNIAIFTGQAPYPNTTIYAEGNILQGNLSTQQEGTNFLAPNVSDVVYLKAGEVIEIHAYHNFGMSLQLNQGSENTYVSIHKVS